MDESELGADVTLIIICHAYQHLLATLSQKLKVPVGLVTVWAFSRRLIWSTNRTFPVSLVFSLNRLLFFRIILQISNSEN